MEEGKAYESVRWAPSSKGEQTVIKSEGFTHTQHPTQGGVRIDRCTVVYLVFEGVNFS